MAKSLILCLLNNTFKPSRDDNHNGEDNDARDGYNGHDIDEEDEEDDVNDQMSGDGGFGRE